MSLSSRQRVGATRCHLANKCGDIGVDETKISLTTRTKRICGCKSMHIIRIVVEEVLFTQALSSASEVIVRADSYRPYVEQINDIVYRCSRKHQLPSSLQKDRKMCHFAVFTVLSATVLHDDDDDDDDDDDNNNK